ncbi:MFS transporter [Herbiconiux sp. VKM Ac-2851]|uniref:MFS transporter n=1 Tax=Herbiconiux sp. VKM Ac-2851 TaxID=2739025 RepID=UPI00156754FF|nr:MFS transporter [Herbiconiux sp. VKM Ac-2851]NQX34555.1 MFS transporter [Herbiconiux sp. VKM Ac-2851]
MSAATASVPVVAPGGERRLPVVALVALALIGFILIAMETMPAGLLPDIASGMATSESTVGLFVSAYALGTVIVTVPAISLTRGLRRKPLLLVGVAGLVLANLVTAVSPDVTLSLVSRFVAGSFSGVIWGMLANYAIRISPPARSGLALSIMSIGAPLGFAFGTPLGAVIGGVTDWRWSFAGVSLLALVVGLIILTVVPDAPGLPAAGRLPLGRVLGLRGVPIVLVVILVWMLAHSTLYTYVAPYLRVTGTGITPDLMLLVYGIASLGGVALVGVLLDRHPRVLLHGSAATFTLAGAVLLVGHASAPAVLIAAVLWGVAFGGTAPQLQSALTRAGGEDADIANSFLPVAFNLAIFGAGILGGLLLTAFDGLILPAAMALLGALALILTVAGRRSAFTAPRS